MREEEQIKDFHDKIGALISKASALHEKSVYPLPMKASAAAERISRGVTTREPEGVFLLISDLSYFIGYMEALTDPKGG